VAPGSSSVEQQNTPVDRLAAIPSSRARQLTFVVVFAVLTLHFASLAIVYLVDPDFAVRQFSRVNRWLGGVRFEPPEVTAWRYATVCGMATLAFMTFLLLMDLGRTSRCSRRRRSSRSSTQCCGSGTRRPITVCRCSSPRASSTCASWRS
jgi:hypothetical protein